MHRSQVFLLILLVFIGGIFLGSFFQVNQTYIWAGIGFCAILITVFFRRDSKLLNPRIAFFAFLAVIFLFGFTRINTSYSQKHILRDFALASANVIDPSGKHKVKVNIAGYVDNEPVRNGKNQSFIFKSKFLISNGVTLGIDERVMINTDFFPEYKYGQKILLTGELIMPKTTASSSLNYAAYLAKDDIFTVMYQPAVKSVNFKLSFFENAKIKTLEKIFSVKSAFEKSVNRSIGEPNAAFINGILLGTRSQIPDDLKNAFARTSTTHILAISGFNITIIAGIIASFLLLFLKRQTAFWFSVVGIFLFTILTGAQASVARAAIMGCLVLLANREGRPYAARNAVVFAGAFMALLNPNILRYDVGFQLSFFATLGLIYFSPFFTEKFKKIPNFLNLRENLAMTISAQIAVLPLLLFYFKNLSIVSLPTNILVLPLVPYSMLLGFISGLTGLFFPFLGQLIGYFAWFLTSIQIFLVRLFSRPSWAALSVGFPWYALIIVYAAMILVIIKLSRVKSKPESK